MSAVEYLLNGQPPEISITPHPAPLCWDSKGFKNIVAWELQRHNKENSKQIFPEKELRGHNPNSYIHVSVSDLYIPMIGLPILLLENRWTA
jgi:hypothetical protein